MERREKFLTILFLIFAGVEANGVQMYSLTDDVLDKLMNFKLNNTFTNYVTESLEKYNDEHIGKSVFGRMINYSGFKPKIKSFGRKAHKMSSMLPLIFHLGTATTWIMITGLLTVKAVAIGLTLLVFKIAVSSAKVASYFTSLKQKLPEHHDVWTPHYNHLGPSDSHRMSQEQWQSYSPSWSYDLAYKTLPESN